VNADCAARLELCRKAYEEGDLGAAEYALCFLDGIQHTQHENGEQVDLMPEWLLRASLALMREGIRACTQNGIGRHGDPDQQLASISKDAQTAAQVVRDLEQGATWADIDSTRAKAYKRTMKRLRAEGGESSMQGILPLPALNKLLARARRRRGRRQLDKLGPQNTDFMDSRPRAAKG
jgi:hypothetical protein